MLASSDGPLVETMDLAMLDLDGVVYVGRQAVMGAPEHLARARAAGMRLAFVTNNAARSPAEVALHLRELGVSADEGDVVTSAQAAAGVLRDLCGEGAAIAVLGADGLRQAVAEAGLRPVGVAADEADAVVTGYAPDVRWRDIMRAAARIRQGLRWVASNTDESFPADFGLAPGHGALVQMVQRFAGVDPTVAGKPAPPLLEETIRRVGGQRPLMVGDRLDTDIEGGMAVGVPTLLVLTGVTGLPELVAAQPALRPTYLSADLGGLFETHQAPHGEDGTICLGGWRASVNGGALEVAGDGRTSDWWRVVATAAWQHLDETGSPATFERLAPAGAAGRRGEPRDG
jgi:HAD superfamily hydrolase (TIGR01450 family)